MSLNIRACPLILLAGGRSSRMGVPKGLLDFNGRPWLQEQLAGFRKVGGREALVVLGFHREAYAESMPWLEEAVHRPVSVQGLKLSAVVNPEPERGQFSSLQCAVPLLGAGKGAAFILPLDVPCPGKEVWEGLAGAFRPALSAVIPRSRNKGGHPVLLSVSFLGRLRGVPLSDPRARLDLQLRSLPPEKVLYLDVTDPRILLNINTPEDFRRFSGV